MLLPAPAQALALPEGAQSGGRGPVLGAGVKQVALEETGNSADSPEDISGALGGPEGQAMEILGGSNLQPWRGGWFRSSRRGE